MTSNSRANLAVLAIVLFTVIIIFSIYEKKSKHVAPPIIGATEQLVVKRIRVISGHEFDLSLEDNRRIHGQLKVTTPTGSESIRKVVAILNTCTEPKVELFENKDNLWKIELYFKVNGQETMLSDWLRQNKLVWE